MEGRDPTSGRFAAGWRGGGGNPYAKKTAELRAALYATVTPDDIKAVVAKLIILAKEGDVVAIRELLDRTLGKPEPTDVLMQVAELEQMLEALRTARMVAQG